MIPKQEENPKGLHQRYIVSKSNGKPIDEKAEYFVLRVDLNGSDPKHIEACRKAVITYAENIQKHLPELAKDLANRYGSEQLILHGVSQRSELLAFEDWVNKNTTTALKDGIKLALENYKKANCG